MISRLTFGFCLYGSALCSYYRKGLEEREKKRSRGGIEREAEGEEGKEKQKQYKKIMFDALMMEKSFFLNS